MTVATIYATYSGSWNHFGGGPFYNWIGQSSQGGNNGGIGGCKLNHNNSNSDDFGDCGKGFVQFNTTSIPANATLHSTYLNVNYTRNNFAFGGVALARSSMAWGNRYDEALDEHTHENVLTGNTTPSSGVVNFTFKSNGEGYISKGGYSKFHVGTSHSLEMVSPGPSAPVGADDFNMSGVDDGNVSNRPKLVITYTTPPAVTTDSADNIQETTADLHGTVTDVGGGTVSERGVCWNTGSNPTIANSRAASAGQGGAFTVGATGLVKNTLYHYRSYVTTENGTQYGTDYNFTTDNTPTLSTNAVTGLQQTRLVSGGNVSDDGNNTITERGVVIALHNTPTTADTKFTTAGTTGSYSTTLTGLKPGTVYYIRAFATNAVGTSYGNEISFRTRCGAALLAFMFR